MKKFIITTIVFSLAFAYLGAAQAGMLIPSADQAKDKAKAPEKSPVISLTDSGEWDLERVDFIHYAKPDNPSKPEKPGKPSKDDTCFKLMGVKWNSLPVNYAINPINNDGLTPDFITQAMSVSAETWDDATTAELFNNAYGVDYSRQYGVQDFVNTIDFGALSNNSIIGVTSVWFTRRGKQIVEFDIRLNDYYAWGDADTNPNPVMDLANITTHELGHAVGMDDIYTSTCAEVTMYGYSGYDEIKKRDLEPADVEGIQKMYGI